MSAFYELQNPASTTGRLEHRSDGSSVQHPPRWSAPELRALKNMHLSELVHEANALMAADELRVLAVSAIGTYRISDDDGDRWQVTLVVQRRLEPRPADALDRLLPPLCTASN